MSFAMKELDSQSSSLEFLTESQLNTLEEDAIWGTCILDLLTESQLNKLENEAISQCGKLYV